MLKIIYFIFLLTISGTSYRIHKDILHPVFICSTMWFLLPFIYELLCFSNTHYHILSDRFYYMILSFFIPFLILVTLIVKKCKRKKIYRVKSESCVHMTNLLYICIFFNLVLILRIAILCESFNIATIVQRFRIVITESPHMITPDIKLLLYIFNLTPPLFCYIFLFNYKIKRTVLFIFCLEFLVITLLYVSKGRMMKYFVMIFSILFLKKKLNLKVIFISILLVFSLIFFMTISRDQKFMENFTFIDYIFVYLLSPLPAFDMLINNKVDFGNLSGGTRLFIFPLRVISRITGIPLPEFDKLFINIPFQDGYVPTNVYTALSGSIMDFGDIGCVLYGILLAIFFGFSYKLFGSSKRIEFILFYLLIVYCLVFQFFGDLFFTFFSMIVQDFICSFLVVNRIKLGVSKYD